MWGRGIARSFSSMVESDPANANLLYQIADEADRGVLVTTERLYTRHVAVNEIEGAKENPPA